MSDIQKVEGLLGRTLVKVEERSNGEELVFTLDDGDKYALYHEQDCCESVQIEDVIGNLDDLVGSPLIEASETESESDGKGAEPPPEGRGYEGSWTWTYYRFATAKGVVTVRWYGESNGYYNEHPNFGKVS